MAIRKRQLVLAALVVALGAAVYLNWQFGGNSQIVDVGATGSTSELGQAQLVNAPVASSEAASSESEGQSGQMSSDAEQKTDTSVYFAQARLERQKSRDSSKELVQKVLDDENAGIYIELVEFDAYTLPNEALASGEIDLNAFQHKAFLENDANANGYDLAVLGDTLIAPLTLYSEKYETLDALKAAAAK